MFSPFYDYYEINPHPNQPHSSNRYSGSGRNYYTHPRNNHNSGFYNNRPYHNGYYNNNPRHINSNYYDYGNDPQHHIKLFEPEKIARNRKIKVMTPEEIEEEKIKQKEKEKGKMNSSSSNPNTNPSSPSPSPSQQKVAANKIYKFINQSRQNKNTKVILKKLLELNSIQQQLLNIQSRYDNNKIGQLTFRINGKDDNKKQILPITKENKMFLMKEDLIFKNLEKLDKIYSDGSDLIRERRKEIVKIAQGMLDELDKEKDRQWKEYLSTMKEDDDNNENNKY